MGNSDERAREIVEARDGSLACDCDYGTRRCPHGARRRMVEAIAKALDDAWKAGRDAAAKVVHDYWTGAEWHCDFVHQLDDLDEEIKALEPGGSGAGGTGT